jgi:hypothetical protein
MRIQSLPPCLICLGCARHAPHERADQKAARLKAPLLHDMPVLSHSSLLLGHTTLKAMPAKKGTSTAT